MTAERAGRRRLLLVVCGVGAVLAGVVAAGVLRAPRQEPGYGGVCGSRDIEFADRPRDLPEVVPAEGWTVDAVQGQRLPVQVRLYPGARVHGVARQVLGVYRVFYILLGTYDAPAEVEAWYRRTVTLARMGESPNDLTNGDHLSSLRWKQPGCVLIVGLLAERKVGVSRDFRRWFPPYDDDAMAGGDPRETMIEIQVVSPVEDEDGSGRARLGE